MKVASRKRIASNIRSLVNAMSLQLESLWVLHESLVIPVLTYGNETMIWREKEKSRIWAVQMDNQRSMLGIRKMDKVPNAQIRQLCRITKGVDEKIDE